MNKNLKSAIKFVLFMALGVLLIWLSIRGLTPKNQSDIIESFKSAKYFWVIIAMICGLLSHLIRANRWRRLLMPMGYKPGIKNMFLATMIGYLANFAFPRLGEVSRCGILARTDKIPMNKSLGTVVTERAFDLFIFIIIFIGTILIESQRLSAHLNEEIYPRFSKKFAFLTNGTFVYMLIGFGILIIGLYFIFRKKLKKSKLFLKIEEIIRGFLHGLRSLFKIKKAWLFILETIATWVLYLLMTYLCFFSIEETAQLGINAGLATLVVGSIGIMVTPGGIGLYPILVQQTLMLYSIVGTIGYALGWIIWSAQTAMILIVGGIALMIISFNKNLTQNHQKNESESENQ